jgi:hypothetical protein
MTHSATARTLLVAALVLAPLAPARAGGGGFDADTGDETDSRATLFGFVKDKDGDPVDDAKITITMKKLNATLVVRSDDTGHYLAKLSYKSVNPDDLDLACDKEGFHEVAKSQRPQLAKDAPIEIDCVLEPR